MIRSSVFTIPRAQFVRVASLQYLSRMWPVFVAFPVFGLLGMVLGPNPFIRAVGFLAFLWPFSIPARVLMAARGTSKRLTQPTWVGLEDEVLYFHDQHGGGMKLPLDQVRRVDVRDGVYVFETRRFNFAMAPVNAFGDADRGAFEAGMATLLAASSRSARRAPA